jgi:protein YibB
MNEITIVTAFFDIGRGDWTPDRGFPHYLQRTTDTYFQRFAHMAKLKNKMIVYTSEEFVNDIKFYRQDNPTEILIVDFKDSFEKLREKVSTVQKNPEYQAKINPMQVRNPEYWNADYVVVNALKSTFVSKAIELGHVETDLVAWLDFGYCRDESTLNGVTTWQYPFNKDKIHFFNIKEWKEGTIIQDVIANNDVHITGPCIIGGKEMWAKLEYLVHHSIEEMVKNDLIDDDQTMLLMSYLFAPNIFELHPVSPDNWFVAFKEYNENTN